MDKGLQGIPWNAQRHCPPVATEGCVKVCTSVFDANIRHWAFCARKIWLIFAWTVLNGLIVLTGLKGLIVTTYLKYSSFRPFSVFHELHTAISHVIIVLKKQSLTCHILHWNSHEACHSNTVMIHNLCLPLSFYLCDLRWTRLHWGGLSSHLPSWIHQGKLQHPHYRWRYLWDWRDLLPYTGNPPTRWGHWCHEGWPIHGYRHHYWWWWWVFYNIIPTHLHILVQPVTYSHPIGPHAV